MSFTITSNLNSFLPVGATRVDTVFGISYAGGADVTAKKFVILLIDSSGSMDEESKMDKARAAARVAVESLPNDTRFAVIFFESKAHVVVEAMLATVQNKRLAHRAIQAFGERGGTAIGKGLLLALRLFSDYPGEVCQLILLTDGKNLGETKEDLADALKACEGEFQVQAIGLGTDWDERELMGIAAKMLGQAISASKITSLDAFFREAVANVLAKAISNVRLRLWMPKSVTIDSFKQGFPSEIDLTNSMTAVDQRIVEFPLGSFGVDSQDYFTNFRVQPQAAGEQVLVCRPSLIWRDPASGQEIETKGPNVMAQWTDDAGLSVRIDRQVAHYSGQSEKAAAIQEGMDAMKRGNEAEATVKLSRALKLAKESGDEATTRRIRQVVDVVDEEAGTVQIRRGVQKSALMDLEVGSTRAVRARPAA